VKQIVFYLLFEERKISTFAIYDLTLFMLLMINTCLDQQRQNTLQMTKEFLISSLSLLNPLISMYFDSRFALLSFLLN